MRDGRPRRTRTRDAPTPHRWGGARSTYALPRTALGGLVQRQRACERAEIRRRARAAKGGGERCAVEQRQRATHRREAARSGRDGEVEREAVVRTVHEIHGVAVTSRKNVRDEFAAPPRKAQCPADRKRWGRGERDRGADCRGSSEERSRIRAGTEKRRVERSRYGPAGGWANNRATKHAEIRRPRRCALDGPLDGDASGRGRRALRQDGQHKQCRHEACRYASLNHRTNPIRRRMEISSRCLRGRIEGARMSRRCNDRGCGLESAAVNEAERLHLGLCTISERLAGALEDARFERREGYIFTAFPTFPLPSFNGVWAHTDAAAEELGDALAEVEELGLPFGVTVRAGRTPAVEEAARRLGLTSSVRIPGMAATPGEP